MPSGGLSNELINIVKKTRWRELWEIKLNLVIKKEKYYCFVFFFANTTAQEFPAAPHLSVPLI